MVQVVLNKSRNCSSFTVLGSPENKMEQKDLEQSTSNRAGENFQAFYSKAEIRVMLYCTKAVAVPVWSPALYVTE